MIKLTNLLNEASKKEYIIWGIPPGERDEAILFTNAENMPEAKRVMDILKDKHGCTKLRVQVLDLSKELDLKKTFGGTVKKETKLNEVTIPKILYHATYKALIPKIKSAGLDTSKSKKAWEDSKPGLVYLATDIDVAGSYAESSDVVPDNWIDNIVVLHIDTNKLDKSKLNIDRNVQDNIGDTLEYKGVIPWTAITKVTQY
jgi:hypothetical protein